MPDDKEEKPEKSEKAYRIEHDRPTCIGCGACAAVAPDFWEMNDDGKSDIKRGKSRDDSWQEREIKEEDFQQNKEAADSCPVNCIHLIKLSDNTKII